MFVKRVSLTILCLRVVAMAAGAPTPAQAGATACPGRECVFVRKKWP